MGESEDPRVLKFVAAARKFREVIEREGLRGKELIRTLLPSLAELYGAALDLEEVRPVDSPDRDFSISHDQWDALFRQLGERIGPDACYWTMFDPTQPDQHGDNPVAGHLGDDLADIYRDVVPALKEWDGGDGSYDASAVDSWRLTFSFHWGAHAVSALRTLHWLEMKDGWGGPLRERSE